MSGMHDRLGLSLGNPCVVGVSLAGVENHDQKQNCASGLYWFGQPAAKEPDFVEAATEDHTAVFLFLLMSAPGLFRIRALTKQPFECPPCRTSHDPAT